MAEWATTPARKHASSGDHECPRGNKSAPSIPLDDRYEVLAWSEVGVDMDVELESLSSFLDGWAMDNLMEAMGMDAAPSGAEDLGANVWGLRDPAKRAVVFSSLIAMRGDIFLLQEVHLRNEEDAAAFTHELEVFRDLPGCLSTMLSLILGGDFNVCLEGRDGVSEGGIDYSARALVEVMKDFSLVDAFWALHPSDAGFTWHNSRGAVSRPDYIFVGRGISGLCPDMTAFVHFGGVDGVRLPGAAGEVLKIQQYADDTMLFVSSVWSLGRMRALTNLFGAGTDSRVNMAKSSVLFCGRWTEDIGNSGGFAVCESGLKILGVRFWARGSAAQNWEARLAFVHSRLGVWSCRRLSLMGKVVVVRSVVLPLLLHLPYFFLVLGSCQDHTNESGVPLLVVRQVQVRETGADVRFGGGGGRGVPRVPLKLDVLYASFASRVFLEQAPHRCFFLARYYLVGYTRLVCHQVVSPSGVPIVNGGPRLLGMPLCRGVLWFGARPSAEGRARDCFS
ncbi:hypothetical protein AAFF_G00053050 [Aldrovandia affinis]|uniref:Endonuclease/exonuclease/phosphatase domain-containing protein n=1 Tax=Aldrovandia affinis TaxID=143900 RepID=A0AAD7WZ76_9TELE|nr:hypothetical protein AAFF_G00053050 [Aldrovandia affinis]